MDVKPDAPVLAEAETYINAPVELVWQVQSAIYLWPVWNRRVRRVRMEGPLQPGTTFRWRSGMNITSVLREVTPGARLGWTGKAIGIRAAQVWEFRPQGRTTCVRTVESFDGWLARIFPSLMRTLLQKSLEDALASLKAECERRRPRPEPSAAPDSGS